MPTLSRKTVLVTGGAGYVGSHACKALAAAGYEVVVLDNLSRGHEWAVRWGTLIKGRVGDAPLLDEIIQRFKPAAVLHFAGYTYVGESVEKPLLYYKNNVLETLTLLDRMVQNGVDRFIFSSSAAVYGNPESVPLKEEHPTVPVNPYGRTKLAIEQVLEDLHRATGMRSVSLRYFNACGADPDGETGECHDPETHLIPLLLGVAAGDRPALSLYGEDYDTPDGTCIRDYVHVSDLAAAHVAALSLLEDHNAAAPINLGNGIGFSVREVIEATHSVTGVPIHVKSAARRAGDPPRLVADASRAWEMLRWKPKHESLESIVETAWRWYRAGQPSGRGPS